MTDSIADPATTPEPRISLWRWAVEGLRASVFLPPRVAAHSPGPLQFLLIVILVFGLDLALGRIGIVGPAEFHFQIWLSNSVWLLLFIGLVWWLRRDTGSAAAPAPATVAACAAVYLLAGLPSALIYQLFTAAIAHGWIAGRWLGAGWMAWGVAIVMLAWSLATAAVLLGRVGDWGWRVAAGALMLVAATGLMLWQFEGNSWSKDYSQEGAAGQAKPRLHLSQQTFEAQQRLLPAQLANLAPRRSGVTNVYGLVFAPYASEDVFLRESRMVGELLARRFDAQGRVLQLVNHASTTETHAWATPENLRRAIAGLAQRMDRERDLLVVYMTSHGASDFKLAAAHWPLEVEGLEPGQLRAALDEAGIRHRVIAISACYSGGWVEQLADENSLVMTAADETHTSYGCGSRSELTFFGRALFDEQLRQTHSFEQAFARAVPLIRRREIEAGKDDGFSNPQIKVGAEIGPLLRGLEQRLDALPPGPPAGAASAAGAVEKSPR